MILPRLEILALALGLSVLAAVAVLFVAGPVMALLDKRHRQAKTDEPVPSQAFILTSDTRNAQPRAGASGPGKVLAQNDAVALLIGRIPDIAARLDDLVCMGHEFVVSAPPRDTELLVTGALRDGQAQIKITGALGSVESAGPADPATLAIEQPELVEMRRIVEAAPVLIWRLSESGEVLWANSAYRALVRRARPETSKASWPLPHLMADVPQKASDSAPRRVSVEFQRADGQGPGERHWFELYSRDEGRETLHFAVPADDVAKAEEGLRNFVQTLTKTFAHLSTGLAVFDRNRRLVLFNPALIDLTTLQPTWLSNRPTLAAFLDQLREKRMMPEPKDYRSWRHAMADLERRAETGTYEETWTLPTGLTYRVTGRPHPEGAVAFQFDDISAEISLTRRFRADLELSQGVLDSLDEAIAVFSAGGILVLSNSAYARLWGTDPGLTLGEISVVDATRNWQRTCRPNPIWGDIRDFVGAMDERAEWLAEAQMNDGRKLACRFVPISSGATLAGFALESDHDSARAEADGERLASVR